MLRQGFRRRPTSQTNPPGSQREGGRHRAEQQMDQRRDAIESDFEAPQPHVPLAGRSCGKSSGPHNHRPGAHACRSRGLALEWAGHGKGQALSRRLPPCKAVPTAPGFWRSAGQLRGGELVVGRSGVLLAAVRRPGVQRAVGPLERGRAAHWRAAGGWMGPQAGDDVCVCVCVLQFRVRCCASANHLG